MESYQFSFEKLIAWQKAKDLTIDIYKLVENFPSSERFGLVDQMKRATISVSSNLAEGNSRDSNKEKRRYVTLAYGSLMELYSHIRIGCELQFISENDFVKTKEKCYELASIISGFRKSLKD